MMDDTFRVTLDGKSMQTIDELFDEISSKLNFPDYFGRNWNAVYDCFQDLAWVEQEKIVVTLINKDYILTKEYNEDTEILYDVFKTTTDYWIEDKTKKVNFIVL